MASPAHPLVLQLERSDGWVAPGIVAVRQRRQRLDLQHRVLVLVDVKDRHDEVDEAGRENPLDVHAQQPRAVQGRQHPQPEPDRRAPPRRLRVHHRPHLRHECAEHRLALWQVLRREQRTAAHVAVDLQPVDVVLGQCLLEQRHALRPGLRRGEVQVALEVVGAEPERGVEGHAAAVGLLDQHRERVAALREQRLHRGPGPPVRGVRHRAGVGALSLRREPQLARAGAVGHGRPDAEPEDEGVHGRVGHHVHRVHHVQVARGPLTNGRGRGETAVPAAPIPGSRDPHPTTHHHPAKRVSLTPSGSTT